MQDLAKLSELASAEIETLRSDGIELTPEEIVEINALGWAVETPEARLSLSRGVPVYIGGCALWPLTLYAQEWFDRVGCRLPGLALQTYALAYAMHYGRTDGEELTHTGIRAAVVVAAWAAKLRCTFGELNEAISQIMQQDEEYEQPPAREGDKRMSIGEVSAMLSAALGGDPDFWERRCAASYAYDVLEASVRQNQVDDKPNAADPRIVATRALGWAVKKIRNKRNG
jgi:hypothetical protein